MIEAIAELVKQGMANVGGAGKNAQVDGDVGANFNGANEQKPSMEQTNAKQSSIMKKINEFGEKIKSASDNAKVETEKGDYTPISTEVVSDERLKEIFGEETPIDSFAKIHAYEFKYTPQAQEMMNGEDHVDDKEHLGVMAQELLENPATSACVIRDTDGFLKVDTAQLTMANTATIAELSRKVQKLEEMIGER